MEAGIHNQVRHLDCQGIHVGHLGLGSEADFGIDLEVADLDSRTEGAAEGMVEVRREIVVDWEEVVAAGELVVVVGEEPDAQTKSFISIHRP